MKATLRGRAGMSAFTLIEVLIVVLIIGLLAAIVIPRYTDATADANDAAVRRTLQILRNQIELYRAHNAADPDIIGPPQWEILEQTEYILGIPVNSLNGLTNVAADTSGGPVGWVWRIGPTGVLNALYATDATGLVELPD